MVLLDYLYVVFNLFHVFISLTAAEGTRQDFIMLQCAKH